MTDADDTTLHSRRMAATLRRLRNQPHAPIGVTDDDVADVIEQGLMRLREGTYTRSYVLTAKGHEFLRLTPTTQTTREKD